MFHRLFDDPGQFLLLGLVVGGVMVWALSYRQRIGDARTARVAAMVILVLWLGFVVLANLIGPTNLAPDIPRSSFNLVPFSSFLHSGFPGRETQEVVGNLALFAPLGAFLPSFPQPSTHCGACA